MSTDLTQVSCDVRLIETVAVPRWRESCLWAYAMLHTYLVQSVEHETWIMMDGFDMIH